MSALTSVEAELHKELLRNVILTGGVACLPGLPERFDEELRTAAAGCGARRLPHSGVACLPHTLGWALPVGVAWRWRTGRDCCLVGVGRTGLPGLLAPALS